MKQLSLLGLLAIGLSACVARDYSTNNRSDVVLRIDKVTGKGSGATTADGDFLLSDVLFKGSVINDSATLTLEALPKNPLNTLASPVNDVELKSYTIDYIRSDGRNVEGVDVPFAISGSLATLIPSNGTAAVSIVAVRHQAKDEPPLKNLVASDSESNRTEPGDPGAVLLTVTARITVYGKTTSGKDVSAVGSLEITFADFGDVAS